MRLRIKNTETPKKRKIYSPDGTMQKIYYGCPGTGKSFKIKEEIEGVDGELAVYFDDKGKKIDTPDTKEERIGKSSNIFRTTFHPDYDYATFVGSYKPVMEVVKEKTENQKEEKELGYSFVPQVFTKAYIRAYNSKKDKTLSSDEKNVYLIIEEINRGNCAQIFGDLFQLLDRDSEGYSDYSIEPDSDLCRYLKAEFANSDIPIQGIKEGRIMKLPPNLFIWATMNTSDQSLFPIDSAFKRRWDWKYTPIKNGEKGHVIALSDRQYDWWEFLDAVNKRIEKVTESEDKQLGYWFAKPEKGISISSEKFVSKVVFYLWNDVFKDYGHDVNSPFVIKQDDGKKVELRFKSFFDENGDVDEAVLIQFFWGLKLQTKAAAPTQAEEDKEDDETPTLEPIGVKESIADQPPTEDESSVDAFEDNEEELPEAKSIDDFFNS
jgi:hypothetical protein